MIAKFQFLKFQNLQLTLSISLKPGGNIEDYGRDEYCKSQVSMGNKSICALKC